MIPTAPPTLLRPDQAAAYLGLSPRTLERWRAAGVGPRHVRVSPRAIRYMAEDLASFVVEQQRRSTSDQGPTAAAAS
jgi:hypothetical protein